MATGTQAAYRDLARVVHPDKLGVSGHGGSTVNDLMARVNAAWTFL